MTSPAVMFPIMPMMGRIGMGNEPEVVTGLMLGGHAGRR